MYMLSFSDGVPSEASVSAITCVLSPAVTKSTSYTLFLTKESVSAVNTTLIPVSSVTPSIIKPG